MISLTIESRASKRTIESEIVKRERIPLSPTKLIENPNYFSGKEESFLKLGIPLIPRANIHLDQELGEGAFGRVFLGTIVSNKLDTTSTLAAIKTLKDVNDYEAAKDFEREAEVLINLNHPNIVRFFGVSIDGDPFMMIFEHMKYGDLNNYLRSHDPAKFLINLEDDTKMGGKANLNLFSLLSISLQIASGLEYLALQHFVHRDLATRNCLVDDNLLIKIGDFGMSRDLYTTDYYKVSKVSSQSNLTIIN